MRRSLFIRFYLFPQKLTSRQTGILMFVRSERKAPSQPFSPILGPDPLRRAQPLFLPDLPPRSSPAGAARQPLSLANESADEHPLRTLGGSRCAAAAAWLEAFGFGCVATAKKDTAQADVRRRRWPIPASVIMRR